MILNLYQLFLNQKKNRNQQQKNKENKRKTDNLLMFVFLSNEVFSEKNNFFFFLCFGQGYFCHFRSIWTDRDAGAPMSDEVKDVLEPLMNFQYRSTFERKKCPL